MKHRKGAAAAAGLLCAIAATMAVWSGPLSAASGAMHTSGSVQAPALHRAAGVRPGR